MINKKYLKLLIWVTTLLTVGYLIGILTRNGLEPWYTTINRSPLTPPNYVFGVAWSVLYIMIAISGWLIWESKNNEYLAKIKKLYISQILLNWSWTPIFFTLHLTGLALIILLGIVFLVGIIIIKGFKQLKLASAFLVPYFIWLIFALYLNGYIWTHN